LLKDVTARLLTEWRSGWTFKKGSDISAVHWSVVKTFFKWAFSTDCVAGLDSLPDNSVACVVTSHPYNIGLKYGAHDDNRSDYPEWMRSVCVGIKRDNGHFFLQVGGIAKNPTISWLVLSMALAAGFVIQNQIVWAKSVTVGNESHGHFKPLNSDRFLNQTYEFIFHLTKTGKVPVDRLAVGVPFADKTNIARFDHEGDDRGVS
jgi:site-specific DNA-methyltransferase (adenine-specific)